jgi:hypothetical protein
MRLATRMVLVTGVLGGLIGVVRVVMGRRSGPAEGGNAIRTGSFDSWPAVPTAPGRNPSGD